MKYRKQTQHWRHYRSGRRILINRGITYKRIKPKKRRKFAAPRGRPKEQKQWGVKVTARPSGYRLERMLMTDRERIRQQENLRRLKERIPSVGRAEPPAVGKLFIPSREQVGTGRIPGRAAEDEDILMGNIEDEEQEELKELEPIGTIEEEESEEDKESLKPIGTIEEEESEEDKESLKPIGIIGQRQTKAAPIPVEIQQTTPGLPTLIEEKGSAEAFTPEELKRMLQKMK